LNSIELKRPKECIFFLVSGWLFSGPSKSIQSFSGLKGLFGFFIQASDSTTFHLRGLAKGFLHYMTLRYIFFATKGIVILGERYQFTASPNPAQAAVRTVCGSATSNLQPSPGLSICRSCWLPQVKEAPQSPCKALSISQLTWQVSSLRPGSCDVILLTCQAQVCSLTRRALQSRSVRGLNLALAGLSHAADRKIILTT